jgi:hypothetical protein
VISPWELHGLWWWSWSFSEKPCKTLRGFSNLFGHRLSINNATCFSKKFQPAMAPDLCRIGWPSTTNGRPWGSGQEKPRSPWAAEEATLTWHLFILYPPVMTNIA